MNAANERRLAALERTRCTAAARPLPVVLADTATDAEVDTLRRSGFDVYRQSDAAFLDLFV